MSQSSRSLRLVPLRGLLPLLALTLLPACGEIEVPVNINLDPQASNTLELVEPSGAVRTADLVGGVEATILLDTDRLLSWRGVVATLRVDDVRLAASSLSLLGQLPTGTLCLEQDPMNESGGFAFLRPLFKEEADFQLTLSALAHVTNPDLAELAAPLPFSGSVQSTVPLDTHDLLALAAGETGALTISETITDTLPPDVILVGGSEVTVDVTLTNADAAPEDPLLDECDAFFADMML